ncbi:glycoside hydrolase family 16 protein [Flavobacterium algicola]|uniref:glycoside hydrolase family 16 protein n=1 Tax=Flavobacterium algicola TaxID=556529 RepID=UPI001EFE9964|nr:glycoside hydrolase family 16 protein [Flavobacterium algicola]MCG9793111.1 glycoside hydrolase family 16 protein [Flavobacterium algicola]
MINHPVKTHFLTNIKRPVLIPLFLLMMQSFFLSSCSSAYEDTTDPIISTRIINFSGYEWIVRTSDEGVQGPGPNYFSDSEENVWVDNQGRLHLKIVNKGGKWYCSGVTLRRSQGYKKYVFYVASRVDQLDQNVVGGLFTYKNDSEEIDIEFSKWSKPENQDSQFAIQPADKAGNKSRYDLKLKNDLSTHFFSWQPKSIEFGSYQGHTLQPIADDVINTWTYTGNDIPPENEENLKINLWLFRGNAPSNNQVAEMIIDHVEIL